MVGDGGIRHSITMHDLSPDSKHSLPREHGRRLDRLSDEHGRRGGCTRLPRGATPDSLHPMVLTQEEALVLLPVKQIR